MRLTRQQIERMAEAVRQSGNGNSFEIEEDEAGKLRVYAIETVERKKPLALTAVQGSVTG